MHAHSITLALSVRWKPVVGFPGYRVSDDGRIETCHQKFRDTLAAGDWHPMTPSPSSKGYLRVSLCRDGKRFDRYIHRLVLEAFVGPCPQGMEGCHDPDPNRENNRLQNLRWDTPVANSQDAVRGGTKPRGEAHGLAVLSEDDVVRIMELRILEGIGKRKIGRRLSLPIGAVSGVIEGNTWAHVTGMNKNERMHER